MLGVNMGPGSSANPTNLNQTKPENSGWVAESQCFATLC